MKPAILRPAAAGDVEDAYAWYESQRTGLGDEFLTAVNQAVAAISENPLQYPVIHRQTRRIFLRRFPYGLYFRLVDDDLVIVACMHGNRDPRRWESRE